MKILQLHLDWIEYEPIKKEIELAEQTERKKYKLEDILGLFVAVEEGDTEEVGKKAIEDVKEFLEKIKTDKILIYPYAHLSNELAEPFVASKIINSMDEYAKKLEIKSSHAPFGWNKALALKIKGHPLAEQLRVYSTEDVKAEVEEKEEPEEGEMEKLLIILPDGSIKERSELGEDHKDIELAIKAELKEISESIFKKPPHIELMRKLEIADYEEISDSGNLRFYPNGTLMVNLLREIGLKMAKDLGAMEVKTPFIINPTHPSVSKMMEKFPERLYRVLPGTRKKKQEFRLRPACDYGVWSMFKDATISYKELPFGLYELDIIWRYEQSGEVLGLYRLRNATMPNLHEMCADLEQAFEKFKQHTKKFALALYRYLEIKPSAIVLNCMEDFFNQHKEFFISLARETKVPIIVKLFKLMKTYKIAWIDVLAFDNLGRPMELVTVQLDTVSADWWNIKFIDKEGKERKPIFLHTGFGIERAIAALLENAYGQSKKDKPPMLPLWLSPEQIRLIPVADRHLKKCEEIADELEKNKIRVGIDDRNETVAKKVFEAKRYWIPYLVVIGDKEEKSGKLPVVKREKSKLKEDFKEEMSLDKLIKEIQEKTKDRPFYPLNVPRLLSKRVVFVPWGSKSI